MGTALVPTLKKAQYQFHDPYGIGKKLRDRIMGAIIYSFWNELVWFEHQFRDPYEFRIRSRVWMDSTKPTGSTIKFGISINSRAGVWFRLCYSTGMSSISVARPVLFQYQL